MSRRLKVAVSVPKELVERADEASRSSKTSRSAVFERALAAYFAGEETAERSRRYVGGYRKAPERAPEIAEALALAKVALTAERWP